MIVSAAVVMVTLTPVAIGTLALLVVAVILAVALSIIIGRGEKPSTPRAKTNRRRTAPAPVTAAVPSAPVDIQDRLRRMTAFEMPAPNDNDLAAERSTSVHEPGDATSATYTAGESTATGAERDRAAAALSAEDQTRFFGDTESGATTFFDDIEPDKHTPHGEDAPDSTTFFGAAEPDATTLFRDDERSENAAAQGDDATRFFDGGDEHAGFGENSAQLFAPETPRVDAPPVDVVPASEASESSHAGLPAQAEPVVEDTRGIPALDSTSFLSALPPSAPVVGTRTLEHVRQLIAEASQSGILVLTVIDGSGRVLGGETDSALMGEVRTLMAESGQGVMADVEQPLRLEDGSAGLLALVPTGANALVGAVLRDDAESGAVRARLRILARDVGDAVNHAS